MFHYIQVPVCNMRSKPENTSPIVSQAYFSEEINILEQKENWAYIQTKVDFYKGWTHLHSIHTQPNPFLKDPSSIAYVSRLAAHVYDREDTTFGPIFTLPFESRLQLIDLEEKHRQTRWIKIILFDGKTGFIQRGDVSLELKPKIKNELKELSLRFLNLPYTWGGRSSFGYDCSGFVQMLYRQIGIYLPRDAKDQATWEGLTSTEDLYLGDLIFWGKSPEEIHHVGLHLEKGYFIHATVAENAPYIRISHINDPEWSGQGRWPYKTTRTLKNTK